MDKYVFDRETDRSGSGDLKHGVLQERYGRADLLPLWVADMDFPTPPFIVEALRECISHPVLGYTVMPPAYRPAICRWISEHQRWQVGEDWIAFIPGVVKGIGAAINVFTRPGDRIIIQPPVYHPFRMAIEGNDRQVVLNPLRESRDGSFYEMDFDHLESVIRGCKMLILCNPHNPAGIAWSERTLRRLARICARHGVIVVSDEIHADLPLFGHRHTPFASVSEEAGAISVTLQAPTKTFNVAAVASAFAIVPDSGLRSRFFRWLSANEIDDAPVFAPAVTVAAFTHGEDWRRQMLRYVEDNILYMEQFFREHIPGIRPVRPEASFLVWLDCRPLGLDHEALLRLFIDGAGLALNDGEIFDTALNPYGPIHQPPCSGTGFMRINVAAPRSVLTRALNRLAAAVAEKDT